MNTPTTDFSQHLPPQTVIATDGACLGNPGPGGWAFVMRRGRQHSQHSGGDPDTTNNRMEMKAIIEALRALSPGEPALVLSDSELTIRGLNEWRHCWAARGWRKVDGKPVANADLWQELSALADAAGTTVTFRHIRGHAGNPLNEEADFLAGCAAKAASGR